MKNTILLILLVVLPMSLLAQYPIIPDNEKAEAQAYLDAFQRRSDSAFAKAYPVIMEQAKHGRPYVPGASQPSDLVKSAIPAFPGAEGGGAFTPGGRGGKVIVVNTLADSGPGSLREAVETGGARVIVFNVSGIIWLKTPVSVRAPYITIAGQTAPGDGICVAGESFNIDTHDVVIRHMRFRRGATYVGNRDDALSGDVIGNTIYDHCSVSWGLDENLSAYRHLFLPEGATKKLKLPTVNITIQNCISSEGLDTYNHAFGSTIGGHNSMFARNLWACNISRNASVGMDGDFNFVNNVIFNWWNRSVDGGDNKSLYNIINNYYKPGPITMKEAPGWRILKPESGRSKENKDLYGKAYVNGNIMEGYPQITKDNWNGGVQIESLPNAGEFKDQIKVDKPFPFGPIAKIMSAKEAFEFVMNNVGATFPKRDKVDERIVRQVRTGKIEYVEGDYPDVAKKYVKRRLPADSYKKGIITTPNQVGGYPEYKGTPIVDTDNDGMPDAWEIKYGLNPKDPSDAIKDCNGDGYTNIEKYINGIDPKKKVNWKELKNNHDTLAGRKSLL
ncbi:thrombospondin type 3 repeat-containing protein [Parabacteroides sp. FAFU027]|uniref:thrombospondin type 3 repeat-containing protein n=1 Tax=Parabacteroides sp. FAFU027 TaxID=2922715 RepID=UPI001FB01D9B|nr:thrombospondin type 3 repeat-containing protein [Parabacteroides sp. FAFU027]